MINNSDLFSCPYEELYIYYLSGRLKSDSRIHAETFLGNWQEDEFSFLFFSKPADRIIDHLLLIHPQLILIDKYNMSYQEWHGDTIKPIRFGRFLITPPWEKSGHDPGAEKIILDPGVVFGTGTHPTTHDCLEALEGLCYEEKIESMLDLGTGTGLLAIAGVRLGCKQALAVDFNFLAAKTAHKNVLCNGLENNILTVHGRAEDFVDRPADLVISNIHYDVMTHLINAEAFLAHKWFILSGLLRSQARDVADRLNKLPVQVVRNWQNDNIWHTFLGKTLNKT